MTDQIDSDVAHPWAPKSPSYIVVLRYRDGSLDVMLRDEESELTCEFANLKSAEIAVGLFDSFVKPNMDDDDIVDYQIVELKI